MKVVDPLSMTLDIEVTVGAGTLKNAHCNGRNRHGYVMCSTSANAGDVYVNQYTNKEI